MHLSVLAWCVALGFLTQEGGCEPKPEPAPLPEVAPSIAPELTDAFLIRATSALADRLSPESALLEIRATGQVFSLHLKSAKTLSASDTEKAIPAGSLVQVDYLETPGEQGQPPIGKIRGPLRVPVKGAGDVEENLFPYAEIDLKAIGRALSIAKRSIDPEDGKVTELIVRRNLPFGKRVRGRIFVDSPRMAGTIDVNEKGAPLKR